MSFQEKQDFTAKMLKEYTTDLVNPMLEKQTVKKLPDSPHFDFTKIEDYFNKM